MPEPTTPANNCTEVIYLGGNRNVRCHLPTLHDGQCEAVTMLGSWEGEVIGRVMWTPKSKDKSSEKM